jgi:hypothetical protein
MSEQKTVLWSQGVEWMSDEQKQSLAGLMASCIHLSPIGSEVAAVIDGRLLSGVVVLVGEA